MQMKRFNDFLFISVLLLFSCNETKQGDLLEIPVDIENNILLQLPLSEIAETITAIELELTDEGLINPNDIKRIILSDDLVMIAQSRNILVFNKDGKFVRSIGSKGQGPGEYINIYNLAMDETNRRLFVNCLTKIICYDLSGNVLTEFSVFRSDRWNQTENSLNHIQDINYLNNELLVIVWSMGNEDENGIFDLAELYQLNDDLQIIESRTIMKFNATSKFTASNSKDYILISDSTVYLYYPFSTALPPNPELKRRIKQLKSALRDTLYRFENDQFVPELQVKFRKNGIDGEGYMFIDLHNVYRSSRYVFAEYYNYAVDYDYYLFYYDTKTRKGYRVLNNRYTDDINQIERVKIRPFTTNPEMFYYWYTHMKPDDLEEPNPTLYIGTLKK